MQRVNTDPGKGLAPNRQQINNGTNNGQGILSYMASLVRNEVMLKLWLFIVYIQRFKGRFYQQIFWLFIIEITIIYNTNDSNHGISTSISKETMKQGKYKGGATGLVTLFGLRDLEIGPTALKNNRYLACPFQLCVSFHSHKGIQIGLMVRKRSGQNWHFRVSHNHGIRQMTLKYNRAPLPYLS